MQRQYQPLIRLDGPLARGEAVTFPNGTRVECIYDATMRIYRVTDPAGVAPGIMGSMIVETVVMRPPATYYDLYAADGILYVRPYRNAANAMRHVEGNAAYQRMIDAEDAALKRLADWRRMQAEREAAYRAKCKAAPYTGPDIDCERTVGGLRWHGHVTTGGA